MAQKNTTEQQLAAKERQRVRENNWRICNKELVAQRNKERYAARTPEQIEEQRRIDRERYQITKKDPVELEKSRTRAREWYYKNVKGNPTAVEKMRERALNRYHEAIKSDPEKTEKAKAASRKWYHEKAKLNPQFMENMRTYAREWRKKKAQQAAAPLFDGEECKIIFSINQPPTVKGTIMNKKVKVFLEDAVGNQIKVKGKKFQRT